MTTKRLQLFLDSNVLTGGLVARWGLDRALLSLCAARVCQLVLAEIVREEVEENLLLHAGQLSESQSEQLLNDYTGLLKLTRAKLIPAPLESEVLTSRHLIRHEADVPVLLSAIKAKPDWLLTHNTKRFSRSVAKKTGLRIATPAEFFRVLTEAIK
jgi:predicted nucleic acid-binding protein